MDKNGIAVKEFSILIVDDDEVILKVTGKYLSDAGYSTETTLSGIRALEKVRQKKYDLVIIDIRLPDINGLQVLKEIKQVSLDTSVLMMTGYGKVETAVEAMKSGADDYLLKPFKSMDVLGMAVGRVKEYRELRKECLYLKAQLDSAVSDSRIIGRSKKMAEIYQLIKKVAPLGSTVLIEGESGTGKELIARAMHENSNRGHKRFVVLNCGAIPANLLESELFGYERGAFTGAISRKDGYFDVADGGTVFLDEISEMSLDLQVKLLRVIQERKFQHVGGTEEITTDVRIIASTNRNLDREVKNKKFRQDLYYRINVIKIHIPPLRERKEDIPILSYHFLKKYTEEFNKQKKSISPKVMNTLMHCRWDGNVRELENVMEHAIAMAEGDEITVSDLPDYLIDSHIDRNKEFVLKPFDVAKRQFEQNYIEIALEHAAGNVALASRLTSIPRQNIYEKIKKYSIDPDRFRT